MNNRASLPAGYDDRDLFFCMQISELKCSHSSNCAIKDGDLMSDACTCSWRASGFSLLERPLIYRFMVR